MSIEYVASRRGRGFCVHLPATAMLVGCVVMMCMQRGSCNLGNSNYPGMLGSAGGRKLMEEQLRWREASVHIDAVSSCSTTLCPTRKDITKLVKKNLITFTVDEVVDAPTPEAKQFEGSRLTTFGSHAKDLVELMAADPAVDSSARSLISNLDYCPLKGDVVLTMKVTVTDVKVLKGKHLDVASLGLPLELEVTLGHEARMKGKKDVDVIVLAA